MGTNAEIKIKYENLVKSASALYLEKQFQKALASYNDALKLATDLNMSKMVVFILKYMICCCLYESNKLEDLAEVVNTLQTMDRTVKNRFPAAYCLLAQTHCKLFRFELAEMEFRNAEAIFSRSSTLETFFIPGTDSPIKPTSKDDETWSKIREECLAYHQPDAICSFSDCNYVAKPYVVPNKNIFLKDPAFNGMVIVNCNNKDQPCVLKFHQSCWKMKKDELYPISRVSDKDILGDKCFTPNCLNSDTACVISSIQVIDQKGELKAHIRENPSTTWSVKPQDKNDKNNSKGAIKKFKVNPAPKRSENPVLNIAIVQQRLLDSLTKSKADAPLAKDIHSEDDIHYYDESQIIIVKDDIVDIDFSHDPPEIAGEKSFLHSLFLDYITKNHVRICDVYSKFQEYNQDLHLKDMDILGFLLHTNNFEVASKKDSTSTATAHTEEVTSQPNENLKAKSADVDCESCVEDLYHELMNDKDEVFVDCTENAVPMKDYKLNIQDSNFDLTLPNNYQSQYNLNNNSFAYEAAGGGDVPEHFKSSANSLAPQSLESCAMLNYGQCPSSFSTGKEESTNRKLKDYITKLENDVEKIMDENYILRKEMMVKQAEIESFKKEQESFEEERESYQEKIKMCEQFLETMTDYQRGYDNMKEENIKIREELRKIMKEKNDLKAKVDELEDPEAKRAQFMKLFQAEYELLEQAVTKEWKNKTDILRKSLKMEIEVKMSLLNKLLSTQYTSNNHALNGCYERCFDFVEVTDRVNAWLEKAINMRNFLDNSEWRSRLEILEVAKSELQSEYSKMTKELHSECDEKFKMTDVNLKTVAIPVAPTGKLADYVINALNAYHRHQCQITQNYILMKAQAATQAATQAMQSYQPQTYNSVHAGYVQQYPAAYASTYPNAQPGAATAAIMPVPTYQPIPRTAGQPTNLILQQQQPAALANSNTSAPVDNVEIEKSKPAVNIEQSAPTEFRPSKEQLQEDANKNADTANKAAEKSDNFKDKIAQMREAFKTIALNVKEKTKCEKVTAGVEQKLVERAPADKIARVEQLEARKAPEKISNEPPAKPTDNQVKDTAESAVSNKKSEANEQAQNIKDAVYIRDDRSDITTLTARDDSKSQKKVGMDGLVKMLLKKFPGAMECDVIEAIAKIRKERNDALTGLPVSRIIEEAKPYIQQIQRLHVIRYFVNDGSK